MIVDALARSEDDAAVRGLIDAFGGDPVEVREGRFGEPAVRSRRLSFASGGEIILRDGIVNAAILHLMPTSFAPQGISLGEWVAPLRNDATLADLKTVFGERWGFAQGGSRYFTLDACYVRADDKRGGGLRSLAFLVDDPKPTCRPEDDLCPACSDLLVRDDRGAVAIDGTVDALAAGVDAGELKEEIGSPVALADLRLVHASGLLEWVESHVSCTACARVMCFTLYRDSDPTFGYYPMDVAWSRPHDPIPPVEEWGDARRIAEVHDAMRYVDHEPGSWFLVEQRGDLYLDARYAINTMVDDSALIRLDESELRQYEQRGHDYLNELARRVNDEGPHREESPFRGRDLTRHPTDARKYQESFSAAIANHTWAASLKHSAARRRRANESADD